MSTAVNYSNIKALELMASMPELLEGNEEITVMANVINFNLADKSQPITNNELVKHLVQENFYLPRLIFAKGQFGVYINGSFKALACNFDADKSSGDVAPNTPIRYDLTIYDSEDINTANSLQLSVSVKAEAKSKIVRDGFAMLVDAEGNIDQKVFVALQALIEPAAVKSIEDGEYTVEAFRPGANSNQLLLTDGTLILVNRFCPVDVKTVKSINGFIYATRNGQILHGISMTGKAERLIDGDEGNYQKGDTFSIEGVATNQGDNKPYVVAKMLNLRTGLSGVHYVDETIGTLTRQMFNIGKPAQVTVTDIRQPTGNMKYPKPVFSIAR